MLEIILASKSKVRKEILSSNGIECEVFPSNVDEDSIKISLQNPAIKYFNKTKKDVQNISNYHYPRSLNDKLIDSIIEQNIIFKKRMFFGILQINLSLMLMLNFL